MIRFASIDQGRIAVDVADAAPLDPGWVRIRVAACGVCGTDLHLMQGMPLPGDSQYPVRPGHEVSGVVIEAAGPEGAALLGRQVVLHPLRTCGECTFCVTGSEQHCVDARILGMQLAGGLADEVVWPARRVVPADGVPAAEAAILADAGATAYHALRAAELGPGGSLCILGAGGVGTQVAAIARALDPMVRIVGVVGSQASADRLAPLVDRVEVGVTGLARRLKADGWVFDAAVDFSTQGDAPAEGARLLVPGGRLILGSVTHEPLVLGPGVLVQWRELVVKGAYSSTIDDLCAVVELASRGDIDLSASVTHRFPLADVEQAMETMAQRPAGMVRVVVEP